MSMQLRILQYEIQARSCFKSFYDAMFIHVCVCACVCLKVKVTYRDGPGA